MAASQLAAAGCDVSLFEKQSGPGRKLLIAGGSGLNIATTLPINEFIPLYKSDGIDWMHLFAGFSIADWLDFIHKLGLETFAGTSGRFFVREMKASGLLRAWLGHLETQGVKLFTGYECRNFEKTTTGKLRLEFTSGNAEDFDAILFALGGGSWQPKGENAGWPGIFTAKNIAFNPFMSSNSGFQIAWKKEFLSEAAQKPLKNIRLKSSAGEKQGDLLITEYGIEGTPVYFCGRSETCYLDLKPDLDLAQIQSRLASVGENLSPLRRAQKKLNLDAPAHSLLFHEAPGEALATITGLAGIIKAFPLKLGERQPLAEAISSSGGVALPEIDRNFMLRKVPGVFLAGEMLDWDAPTGGFLIQACVAQGFAAAQGILEYARGK